MEIKRYYTKMSWEQAVALAKAEGHKFLGLTTFGACFTDMILVREY